MGSNQSLTIAHPNGPQAKLNAAISIITKLMMTLPNVWLGVPPGIPRHPTTKMEIVIIPVVIISSGRLGILFASNTAAKTTKTWIMKTISVIRNGSLSPMAFEKTVPK